MKESSFLNRYQVNLAMTPSQPVRHILVEPFIGQEARASSSRRGIIQERFLPDRRAHSLVSQV
jgi:hypothetical protein